MPKEVEHCVTSIIPRLRKQYPSKSDDEIRQIAWATCNKLYKEGKLAAELSLGEKYQLVFPKKKS